MAVQTTGGSTAALAVSETRDAHTAPPALPRPRAPTRRPGLPQPAPPPRLARAARRGTQCRCLRGQAASPAAAGAPQGSARPTGPSRRACGRAGPAAGVRRGRTRVPAQGQPAVRPLQVLLGGVALHAQHLVVTLHGGGSGGSA